ncbi:endo alpha-1,4 polygalactosaminidase [Streptomyces fildesensis]|uniref:Endo alpha-1,4 polygalactosaminidase n=1 Tax=Streptomyces fildesensis TaxID=375757 RepID=A0ABW8CGE2_9ACTN
MRSHRRSRTTAIVAGLAVATALGATAVSLGSIRAQATPTVALPPVHALFDYQIGGAYTPPAGVKVVSRDVKDSPAKGLYNICYVNAFQTQEKGDADGPQDWAPDLLLSNSKGPVIDPDWNEAILDITTGAKRQRIAAKINGFIDQCASKGFNAVELDNYDTFTRDVVGGKITASHAQSYIRLLSQHGHSKGLAVAQKNTVELAANHAANGLDFAIAEECGDPKWKECGKYISAFGNNAIFIEYTSAGLKNACVYGAQASVVRRDVEVVPARSSGYVRKTC